MIPHNFLGGGGAFGNRYFMNIYPAFLFLFTGFTFTRMSWFILGLVPAVFLGGAIMQPLYTSFHPADHAKFFPYRFLPPELTCVYNLPSNVNPHYFNVKYHKPIGYSIFFLDDSTTGNTTIAGNGFWVYGEKVADLVVRPFYPICGIKVFVRNGYVNNTITVKCAGDKFKRFMLPGQEETFEFLSEGDITYKKVSLLKVRISSRQGFVPYAMDETSNDRRHLGCFVMIKVIPREWVAGLNLQENGNWADALAQFKTAEYMKYDDPMLFKKISECYEHLNKPEKAVAYREKYEKLTE
jgi:hypothetical protein